MPKITAYSCEHCGDSSALVLLSEVIGEVLLGKVTVNGVEQWAADGGPEHYLVLPAHQHKVWCDDCGRTTVPVATPT